MANAFAAVVWLLANALGKCQFVVDRQVPTGSWQFKIIYVYVVLEVSEGEGNGNPLQYSCQENPVDRGAWWAAVHRITQSQTRLKRLSMHACIGEGNGNPLQCSRLENQATGTGEPGGLPSMGSHSVGHDWSDLAAAAVTNGLPW